MAPVRPVLFPTVATVQCFGANTNVGKTVFLTGLARHQAVKDRPVRYIKPVSTGPQSESDDTHIRRFAPTAQSDALFSFPHPVSPHLAAQADGRIVTDETVTHALRQAIQASVDGLDLSTASRGQVILVETAGGPLSPSPAGTAQADLYRCLRLPVVLVADSRLGGISATISAYESLTIRGFDIVAIVGFDTRQWGNQSYLAQYFGSGRLHSTSISTAVLSPIPIFTLPEPPARDVREDQKTDHDRMADYYTNLSHSASLAEFAAEIDQQHTLRLDKLASLPARAHANIWYPFTQHAGRKPSDIAVFDSAHGSHFHTAAVPSPPASPPQSTPPNPDKTKSALSTSFDASASWWTQGLGHGNPRLALAAAYAAGRYGHVMFPGAANEPAIELAETVLDQMAAEHGRRRLTRAFYSDDGSTAVEVAIKMALRAYDHRVGAAQKTDTNTVVVGLKCSYHGDTIGAMSSSEPSVVNSTVGWYRPRGFWLDFPTVSVQKGKWVVEFAGPFSSRRSQFNSLADIFDLAARQEDANAYRQIIVAELDRVLEQGRRSNRRIGALILEPIILGAGGMLFVDPLYQSVLVQVVRSSGQLFGTDQRNPGDDSNTWTGLPVIYDEVFTGIFRLGRFSSSAWFRPEDDGSSTSTAPDLSVHAKLLTGGLVPLSITLASDSIFSAFAGSSSATALLHGHSYTAHPVGCKVGLESVRMLADLHSDGEGSNMSSVKSTPSSALAIVERMKTKGQWSVWSDGLVDRLSHLESVQSVFSIGTVFAVSVKPNKGESGGYTSLACIKIRDHLLVAGDVNPAHTNMYIRVLGNVLYLMASHTSTVDELCQVEVTLEEAFRSI